MIILDACRHDLFREIIGEYNLNLKGRLEHRISRGSGTVEFLLENFKENFKEKLEDIVYVTATPHVNRYLKGRFFKIVSVWKTGWDNRLNTVPPDTVYYATLNAIRRYNNKKFIIHFLQPHYPFIRLAEFNELRSKAGILAGYPSKEPAFRPLQRGEINIDVVLWGYRENLRLVVPYLDRLRKVLEGKIVITSDHGEGFGEKIFPLLPLKVWGHPGRIRIEPLVKVPWFVCEGEGRIDLAELEIIKQKVRMIAKK